MRKYLLLAGLLATASSARAQFSGLLLGVSDVSRIISALPQGEQRFVTTARYGPYTFPMKRTPPDQIPRRGSSQIMAVEQLLAGYEATLRTDSVSLIFPPSEENKFAVASSNLAGALMTWNQTAYGKEMDFYSAVNKVRQDRQAAQLAQFVREARAESRRDSLAAAAAAAPAPARKPKK